MDDETILTFGKYKGIKLANIPATYLLWLYENNKSINISMIKNRHIKQEMLRIINFIKIN